MNRKIAQIKQNIMPEMLHMVTYEGVAINSIPSQVFYFGRIGMNNNEAPLCSRGCGEKVKWNKWENKWNKFINGHQNRSARYLKKFEPPPLCKCGCMDFVKYHSWKNKWNKYIHGHNPITNRISENFYIVSLKNRFKKGYKHTEEWKKIAQKRMMGKQYALGFKHSKEWKENASRARSGENNPMYGKSGALSPSWKGGISCEPYCNVWTDQEYKQSIKDRDNNECRNPDCLKNSKKLCIHHINYNKKDCAPKNLIALCNSCNSRANHNRKNWKEFYQKIMSKKYGYKYE